MFELNEEAKSEVNIQTVSVLFPNPDSYQVKLCRFLTLQAMMILSAVGFFTIGNENDTSDSKESESIRSESVNPNQEEAYIQFIDTTKQAENQSAVLEMANHLPNPKEFRQGVKKLLNELKLGEVIVPLQNLTASVEQNGWSDDAFNQFVEVCRQTANVKPETLQKAKPLFYAITQSSEIKEAIDAGRTNKRRWQKDLPFALLGGSFLMLVAGATDSYRYYKKNKKVYSYFYDFAKSFEKNDWRDKDFARLVTNVKEQDLLLAGKLYDHYEDLKRYMTHPSVYITVSILAAQENCENEDVWVSTMLNILELKTQMNLEHYDEPIKPEVYINKNSVIIALFATGVAFGIYNQSVPTLETSIARDQEKAYYEIQRMERPTSVVETRDWERQSPAEKGQSEKIVQKRLFSKPENVAQR